MKHLCSILFIALLLTACGSSKKVSNSVSVSTDTLTSQAETETENENDWWSTSETNDTVVVIPEKRLEDFIPHEDTEIPKTNAGKKVPRSFSKRQNGMEIWVKIDTNQNVRYGGSCDSQLILIENLRRTCDSFRQRASQKQTTATNHTSTTSIEQTTWTKKVRAALGGFGWVLIVAVLAIGIYLGRLTKRFIP